MKPGKNKKNIGGGKFMLLIGDEGAVMVHIKDGAVIKRLFAQSPEPMHVKAMEEAFLEAPNAPISILFDMMDQSYVRQTLPPVSSFSVGKIINRRLNKDFSPDDIKGYILLDREKTGRKDWNYLMVSLANNATLQKWVAFVTERSNPFKGMGLLPLESQNLIRALEKSFAKKPEKTAKLMEWQVLVSHNKVGGFRQIVMRGGRLVFTRMALPFGESTPGVIAGNIEQEMINTLEYLKRLGLQDPLSISISIICSAEIKQALDPRNIKAGEHHFMTPFEAAERLSLKDAAQQNDHFGDVVIAAFIARQRKLLLTLNTAYTKKLQSFAMYILQAKAAAALAGLGLLSWIGASVFDIVTVRQDIERLETKHKTLSDDLTKIKARALTLPKNIGPYTDLMNISQLFAKPQLDPLNIVSGIAAGIADNALANAFSFVMNDPLNVNKNADKRQIQSELTVRLTTPSSGAHGNEMQPLLERLRKNLPSFAINLPEAQAGSENKDIKTIISDNGTMQADAGHAQFDNIKISITGPVPDKTGQNKTPRTGR